MGNHEWCDMCGESCFHDGGQCNPERRAAYQAEEKRRDAECALAKGAARRLCLMLRGQGWDAELDNYGNVVLPWNQFLPGR